MTPKQYQWAIEKLGLSQRGSARFLCVNERTVRDWVAGESRIPHAVDLLFTLMIKLKIDPAKI
jgi:DNA-binding transcriptional regulator YiaG